MEPAAFCIWPQINGPFFPPMLVSTHKRTQSALTNVRPPQCAPTNLPRCTIPRKRPLTFAHHARAHQAQDWRPGATLPAAGHAHKPRSRSIWARRAAWLPECMLVSGGKRLGAYGMGITLQVSQDMYAGVWSVRLLRVQGEREKRVN